MIFRALGFFILMISSAVASDWTLDADASKLTFSGTQTGVPFEGHFRRFSATIHLDPDALDDASITVTIDPSSAFTGNAERDSILPGTDWFDVATHPTATFVSTDVVELENGYTATGVLTLKGTAQEIHLPFGLRIEGDTVRSVGGVTIDRSDFSIGAGPLGEMVGSDVTIKFNLTATR